MRAGLQSGSKQRVDIDYVNTSQFTVEENFDEFFPNHDDLALAQILQDQETVYQSLQRNSKIGTTRSSSTTSNEEVDGRLRRYESSSRSINPKSQLSLDEAYAQELQDLEIQLSDTYLNEASGTGSDNNTRTQSSTSTSQGSSASNASTQVARQDDMDPDNMTYEELQSLGEAIGTESRGLSDEFISYLPVSTYKTGIFSRREKNEECVICYMTYKNKDKLITLPCQHQYHKDCVTRWLSLNKACPVCNEEVFGS